MVVTTESVHEEKYRVSSSGVYHHLDIRQRELVFRTDLVEVSKVDTASYLVVLLIDRDNVSEPCRMLDRFNKANVE